jgi:hypothetical protein
MPKSQDARKKAPTGVANDPPSAHGPGFSYSEAAIPASAMNFPRAADFPKDGRQKFIYVNLATKTLGARAAGRQPLAHICPPLTAPFAPVPFADKRKTGPREE